MLTRDTKASLSQTYLLYSFLQYQPSLCIDVHLLCFISSALRLIYTYKCSEQIYLQIIALYCYIE